MKASEELLSRHRQQSVSEKRENRNMMIEPGVTADLIPHGNGEIINKN